MSVHPILAVIPCRGGSKGLPGKNIRPLAGLPLVAHSIRFARLCPEIAQCIVSTDNKEIAAVALAYGGEVPFMRPTELAQDDTPMWPVLQHALRDMERRNACTYGSLLLLDPTSPGRYRVDLQQAIQILEQDARYVGVVTASEPHFNPRWVCIETRPDGSIAPCVPGADSYTRRQDVPVVYRINGALYLWRRDHVLDSDKADLYARPHSFVAIPEDRAIHIDEIKDFNLAEILIREGWVRLPWL